MILEDLKKLKTGAHELRKFGLLVGGVFALLGLFFWLRQKPLFPYFLIPGLALMLTGISFPRALKIVYLVWMAMAFTIGFVVSHVILLLFFYIVVCPIGLSARLFRKDFLSLKLDQESQSYWIPRESRVKTTSDYERQF